MPCPHIPSSGRLVYIMGASGSGKDTLMQRARKDLDSGLAVTFAHRYITRPANAGGENHVHLDEREFQARLERGLFALHWRSHGLRYGLGIEIDSWMRAGFTVVMNGSRQHLPEAAHRYADILPVLVEVEPRILLERLHNRGRENPDQIRARLDRACTHDVAHPALIRIDNSVAIDAASRTFLDLLAQTARASTSPASS